MTLRLEFWPMWYTKRDERVCPVCKAMHGRVYPPALYPPKPHPKCRCEPMMVPVWIGSDGTPTFEPPEEGMPGWPDDEPEPIYEPGWLDEIPAEARKAWVLLVAYLLRSNRPVPEGLEKLIPEATEYNAEREANDDPAAQADENTWWWALIPADERDEIEESDLLQYYQDLDKRDQMSGKNGKQKPVTNQTMRLPTGALHLAAGGDRREYEVRICRAGRIVSRDQRPGHIDMTAEALQDAQARGLFNSALSFVDHEDWDLPSLHNLAGVVISNEWDPQDRAVNGVIRLYDTPAGSVIQTIFDEMLADLAAGDEPPNIGLSIVFFAERWEFTDDWQQPDKVLELRYIESVDFVFSPAADGRIKKALSAQSPKGVSSMLTKEESKAILAATDLPTAAQERLAAGEYASAAALTTAIQQERTALQAAPPAQPERRQEQPAQEPPAPAALGAEWVSAMAAAAVPTILASSGLPEASRNRLAAGRYNGPAELEAAITAERAYLAALSQDNTIQVGGIAPRGGHVQMGRTGLEQVALAAEAMLGGVRAPDGVAPLTGIRELYHLLSGDYEMKGIFQPERIRFANVNTSTMANLVADALNKRVVIMFQQYPQWWGPIVFEEDFNSLQQIKWITLGGIGELPTVAEGAAYTELTWDDKQETSDFVKKGGYLGLTIEAIDKDDTGRIRAAPRALAQAAWLTLSKSVSAIFTANSGVGPTLADTGALFNATAVATTGGHANLLTAALSHSAYVAVRTAMMKQTELGSGERLAALTAPKYILVPIDLEVTAMETLATEMKPGAAEFNENVFAEGDAHEARMQAARRRIITVPLWTDTNNWAAVADPMLYPSIGVGYRYGRAPEIFSVASPTAGLMFTNDTMPIKVRFFFAVGPTDYRGLHKNNVS